MVRARQQYERLPWADRFNRPTDRMLRAPLPSPHASLLEQARERLSDIPGLEERIAWQGACWRWTFAYHAPDLGRVAAIIIPNPSDLQVAVPVQQAFVRSVLVRRLRRALREGLELAAEPFDTEWGMWSITSETLLHEVAALAREQVAFSRAQSRVT